MRAVKRRSWVSTQPRRPRFTSSSDANPSTATIRAPSPNPPSRASPLSRRTPATTVSTIDVAHASALRRTVRRSEVDSTTWPAAWSTPPPGTYLLSCDAYMAPRTSRGSTVGPRSTDQARAADTPAPP